MRKTTEVGHLLTMKTLAGMIMTKMIITSEIRRFLIKDIANIMIWKKLLIRR